MKFAFIINREDFKSGMLGGGGEGGEMMGKFDTVAYGFIECIKISLTDHMF